MGNREGSVGRPVGWVGRGRAGRGWIGGLVDCWIDGSSIGGLMVGLLGWQWRWFVGGESAALSLVAYLYG